MKEIKGFLGLFVLVFLFPVIAEAVLFIKREVLPTSRGNCLALLQDIVKVLKFTLNIHTCRFGSGLLSIVYSYPIRHLWQTSAMKRTGMGGEGKRRLLEMKTTAH